MRGLVMTCIALLLGGCAPGRGARHVTAPLPPPILGTRADATVRAGSFDGYVVEDRCGEPDCFGVRGTGAAWFEGEQPLAGFDDVATRERWRALIVGAIARPSVGGSGFGRACRQGGLYVELADWRDVDGAVARVGAALARGGWRDEVGLCVRSSITAEDLAQSRR